MIVRISIQLFPASMCTYFITSLLGVWSLLNCALITATKPKFYESLSPALGLEKNASMQKITKYYEKLYLRLYSKDYGFAKFGESCEVFTIDEIEDHLDMAYNIIRDQDEDGKYRRAVEEHLRPKLRTFYYRSKTFCDFLKLLICDPSSNQCVCADKSMGIGRNESCQINIGKRCDLNATHLLRMGIPSIPELPLDVSCINQAECVSSFGAASKLCKCKKGYFGAGCKPSLYHTWAHPSKTIQQKGRGIMGASGTNMEGSTSTEYFLYPEEIKHELVKLMNIRGMFDPEDREAEAEELYSKMERDSEKEEMVIRDIYFRKLASINHGEKCDPEKQLTLDNPPLAKDSSTWVDPKSKDVKQWQLYMLRDDKPVCDFVRFLRCDEKTMVCKCKSGLIYESNYCRLHVGKACGVDYDGTYEFDPLKDQKRFSAPLSPVCVSGAECKSISLFFMKQCLCPQGKTCGNSSSSVKPPPANLTLTIQKRFSLNLGETCDPNSHSLLLDPKDSEVRDYNLRTASLLKLITAKPAIHFCNLDKFLNCSSTKKCECFDQLVDEGGHCRAQNMDSCEATFSYGNNLYPSGPKLWKIEQVFQKSFRPQCVKSATCGNDKVVGKCVCKNGKAGPLCEDPKSVFASVLNPANVRGYNPDRKINQIFYSLNFFTYKMEELMTLTHGEECNPASSHMVERVRSFFRDVGSSDDSVAGKKTLYQYQKAAKWIEYLLRSGVMELCNQFLSLKCHPTSHKCHCPTGYAYEDKICKLILFQDCDPNPVASWIPICRHNTHCLPATSTTKSSCQCQDNWSGADCSTNTPSISSSIVTSTDQDKCRGKNVTLNISGVTINECLDPLSESDALLDNIIPDNTEPDKFEDISDMLERIVNNRGLSLNSDCDPQNESLFTQLFPSLPRFTKQQYKALPMGIIFTYSKLLSIDNAGEKFCDRKRFLVCNAQSRKCDCDPHVFHREGPECRLQEGSFCGEIGTIYDRGVDVLPLCMTGTKCEKVGYGVHNCVKNINGNALDY